MIDFMAMPDKIWVSTDQKLDVCQLAKLSDMLGGFLKNQDVLFFAPGDLEKLNLIFFYKPSEEMQAQQLTKLPEPRSFTEEDPEEEDPEEDD